MIFKKVLSAVLSLSIAASTLVFSAVTASAAKTESYGENLVTGGDFEGKAVGESTSTNWQPYYNRDVAFGDIVSNEGEGNENNVYEGTRAVRFCNVGAGNSGRGLYYAPSADLNAIVEGGATYCLSGYFRTNNPDGERLGVLLQLNKWAVDSNGDMLFANVTDEWQEFKFYTTMPANGTFGTVRLCAMNVSPECLATSKGYAGNKAALDASETGYCIYADNIQLRKVYNTGADNPVISATDFSSDGILFADYDYWGKDAEGASTLKWLYADSADAPESEWQTYKSETVSADEDTSESMLIPGAALGGKYVKISVTAKDMYGNVGQTVMSDAYQIVKKSNVMPNGTFAKDLYIWTGDAVYSNENCDSSESGSMAVSGEASFAHESVTFDIDALTIKTEFYAKSNGSDTVIVDGNTFTLTDEWQKFEYERYITSDDDFEVNISSDGCLIDNFSIIPQIPEVYSISVTGKYVTGATLEISYERSWEGDDNSTVEWYFADNDMGENPQKIGDGKSVTLINEYASKYIFAVVTPYDDENQQGLPLRSAIAECIGLYADNLVITSNGHKTNSVLVPSYEYHGAYAEGDSKIEWEMAPSLKTPDDLWTSIVNTYSYSMSLIPAAAVTEDTVSDKGFLLLNQDQLNMYVRFKITPVNENGDEGVAVYSEPTELIEFERNVINNGDFSMGVVGWHKQRVTNAITLDTEDITGDGTGCMYINAPGAGIGTNNAYNAGSDMFYYYPSKAFDDNVPYELSFDAKLLSDNKILMTLLAVTNAAASGGVGILYTTPTYVEDEWIHISTVDKKVIGDDWAYLSVRPNGSETTRTVGDVKFDNFSFIPQIPWISDLEVEGNPKVGSTLTATYKFNKIAEMGKEYNTQLRWEKADYPWGPWTTVKSYTGTDSDVYPLDITSELDGKYLRFYMTTEDELGNKAVPMWTGQEIFVEPGDVYDYTVSSETLTAGTPVEIDASFESAQELERDITVVAAIYKTVGDKEKMTSIAYATDTVGSYGNVDIPLSITPTEDGGELRVYFMEGDNFKTLKPLHSFDASGASAGNGKTQILVDNDSATVTAMGKTTVPGSVYGISVIRSAYDSTTITPSNVATAVEYFGQGTSADDKSFAFDFSISGASEGSEYALYVVQKNGEKQSKKAFTYSGSIVSDAIAGAVLAADSNTFGSYLDGTLINGTIDLVDVLAIDLTDYENVEDKTAVHSLIAGKDYNGKTIQIKLDVEEFSKAQLEYEVWTAEMDEFIADFSAATTSTLANILKKHNELFELDLDNEYGFAINLNSTNREKFNTDVLNALKGELAGTHEEVEAGIKSQFKNSVALAAVNYGAWEDMGNILSTHSKTLGISLSNYNSLTSGQKTTLHQNIYNGQYDSIATFSGGFEAMVTAAEKTTPVVVIPAGGGGTTSSSGGVVPVQPTPGSNAGTSSMFSDVPSSHWAYDAISLCKTKGIINGYDNGTFCPENRITRAEFLTIIMKTLGIETQDNVCEFTDVSETDWYYDTVATAAKLGISNGYDDGTFKPNYYITREEMCVFITRSLSALDITLDGDASASYNDADQFASYAVSSITALSKAGIVNGMGEGEFAPKGLVNRAMAAKISYELTLGL